MKYSFECLIKGISGAEGPNVDLQNRIFMVEPNHGWILEVRADGTRRNHVNTGGVPAGLQVDQENNLWCADMELGILRVTPDGKIFREVREFEGSPIRGCNDWYFDSCGNLYFTAPAGSNKDTPVGQVFCRLASGEVMELDNGYHFSNGLAVTAGDKKLVVAETFTMVLWLYDIDEPGRVINKRKLATLPGEQRLGPDGMDFDAESYLLVANVRHSSIDVFSMEGTLVERIMTPFVKVTNVHFAGPNSKELLVTGCSTYGLWKTCWRNTGQLQYCDRRREPRV